eukprot:CAMPEP_0170243202 /NCGR_PEP_ID=MMETSP0116_2-20130129/21375_1 /TAXON_ID=400756 /ORGANISM="Durinskia baltica, Strain CSIRO CS-38" /LENGTH=272 /DNA_ID=CAMNT_0010494053 /DNA_START=40 /DNA_END=855 /DNA_ORIENTATION=-
MANSWDLGEDELATSSAEDSESEESEASARSRSPRACSAADSLPLNCPPGMEWWAVPLRSAALASSCAPSFQRTTVRPMIHASVCSGLLTEMFGAKALRGFRSPYELFTYELRSRGYAVTTYRLNMSSFLKFPERDRLYIVYFDAASGGQDAIKFMDTAMQEFEKSTRLNLMRDFAKAVGAQDMFQSINDTLLQRVEASAITRVTTAAERVCDSADNVTYLAAEHSPKPAALVKRLLEKMSEVRRFLAEVVRDPGAPGSAASAARGQQLLKA